MSDPELAYEWSEDNLREVESGYIKRATSIVELASAVGLDPGDLDITVTRWNQACLSQRDDEFGRPSYNFV